jgi:hypothetical protein
MLKNKGLKDVTMGRNLDRMIGVKNSCELDKVSTGAPIGIGVKIVMENL